MSTAMMGKAIPADVNALITSVQGVGMSSTQSDKNTNQFEALLTLKPTISATKVAASDTKSAYAD